MGGGGGKYARWNLSWGLESHQVKVHLILGGDSLSPKNTTNP